jgi:hypothetical protein
MKALGKILFCCLFGGVGLVVCAGYALAQTAPHGEERAAVSYRDGQHDFDFNLGKWKTHIKQLEHPLTGSKTWVELNGTVVVRKIWGGRAQWEEIEAEGTTGHFEGLTLFLYDPQAHQWSQSFASGDSGRLEQPVVGEFKNGRGEFIDQESFHGRTILVRMTWSDISANAHHVEQAYSDDGGKTWEPNFVAMLTRAQ